MKVTLTSAGGGFDKLQRELQEFQQAMESLNGTVANLKFTSEPESVAAAIQQIEQAVDDKVAPYSPNRMVAQMAEKLKERYRTHIREVASGKK